MVLRMNQDLLRKIQLGPWFMLEYDHNGVASKIIIGGTYEPKRLCFARQLLPKFEITQQSCLFLLCASRHNRPVGPPFRVVTMGHMMKAWRKILALKLV